MTRDGTERKTAERLERLAKVFRRKAAATLQQPRMMEAFRREKAFLYRRFARLLEHLAGKHEG